MAIKIHPIQERLRQGKNKPQPKNQTAQARNIANGNHPEKGLFNGRCNVTACQEPGAVFFNTGSNAYYCSECAADIHAGTRHHLDWLHERMIYLRDDQPEKELTLDTVETEDDINRFRNRRVEARMAADWARWQERRQNETVVQ